MERLPPSEPTDALVPTSGTAIGHAEEFGGLQTGPDRGGGGFPIARIIAAITRYRWLVLLIIVLGTAGAILATRFIDPVYRTGATIYLEGRRGAAGPIQPAQLLQENSWIQLLRSYAVLDPVVRKTKIFVEAPPEDTLAFQALELGPRFRAGKFRLKLDQTGRRYTLLSAQGLPVDQGAVGDSIGLKLGWLWAPPPSALGKDREVKFTVRTPRSASEELQTRLRTVLPEDGAFMTVSLSGTDPEQISTVLNAILDQFVQVAADIKQKKLTELTRDLEDQLRTADSSARAAETSLEGYRIATITEPREEAQYPIPGGLAQTQPSVMTNYYAKKLQLQALQKERRSIEDVLRRGKEQGVVAVDAFHTIALVGRAPDLVNALAEVTKTESEIRVARARYTDEHKIIQDLNLRLDELKTKVVPVYAARLVEQLKLQEAELQREIDIETGELKKIPIRTMTEEKLRREAKSAVELSQDLQDRLQANKLAIMAATPDLTVLDRAEIPTEPSSSTAPRIIMMGVAASIGFALLLAVALDRLDKRFRYPEQASEELGLTILGAVPVIRKGRGVVRSPAETAQIVEAFRSIRLNLVHSFASNAPITVTITSPAPGDGKSLVAANLAISFAEAGYRTLLVDGDTRRGELFRMFQSDRQPGLLDFLDGQVDAESIIRPTAHDRLSLVPSGSRLPRGPELLGSARMLELIRNLANQFQVILVDSPPLGAGVDPFVLGTMTGNVVVVLRAGETDRQLATAKVQLLDRLPTRVVGAVLNHINLEEGAYKYYAYEYPYHGEDAIEQIETGETETAPSGAAR